MRPRTTQTCWSRWNRSSRKPAPGWRRCNPARARLLPLWARGPAHDDAVGVDHLAMTRKPRAWLLHELLLDVVERPQLSQQFRDREMAAVRAIGRRTDVPVRRDVAGRLPPVRQRYVAPLALRRPDLLELAIENRVQLCGGNGRSAHGMLITIRCTTGSTVRGCPVAPVRRRFAAIVPGSQWAARAIMRTHDARRPGIRPRFLGPPRRPRPAAKIGPPRRSHLDRGARCDPGRQDDRDHTHRRH